MDKFGACPRQLHYCPTCQDGPEGILIANPDGALYNSSWCKTLLCRQCKQKWFICVQCLYTRAHLKDTQALRRHYRLAHADDYNTRTYSKPLHGKAQKFSKKRTTECLMVCSPVATSTQLSESISMEEESDSDSEPYPFELIDNFSIIDESSSIDCYYYESLSEEDQSYDQSYDGDAITDHHTRPFSDSHILTMGQTSVDTLSTNSSIKIPMNFELQQSCEYFRKETFSVGSGARYLLAKSFFSGTGMTGEEILAEDVNICLQVTLLVQALNTRQNKLLANFINLLLAKVDLIARSNKYCPNCTCQSCKSFSKPEQPISHVNTHSVDPLL